MAGDLSGSLRSQTGSASARLAVRLLTALILVAVAGCGPTSETGGGVQAAPTYQVPDSACPDGWSGLAVTTDNEAEIEHLDDIPACVDGSGTTIYLKNESDAVWVLQPTSASSGQATPFESSYVEQSFTEAVQPHFPGRVLLVPGGQLTVDLRSDQFEWVIDLPLSFAWQAHDVVANKIASAGEAAALAALRRQSPAGSALTVCTLAAMEHAKAIEDLEDADASEVLLDGLGVGVATSQCRLQSAQVAHVDDLGRATSLADDLARLQVQTELLEQLDGRLSLAQRAARVLGLGLSFVR